jgi:hypothetical protein
MTINLYAFTYGTVTGAFAHLMEGGEGDITVPVPVFRIEHLRGGRYSTPGCTQIASMTPLDGSARDSPGFSASAFSRAKK